MSTDSFIVDTKYGPVKGTTKLSLLGQQYFSFQGIPYARPPVGKLRFKAPIAPESWTQVLDCTQQCSPCYHFDKRVNEIVGSEDSLRVNVFTKTIDKSNLLPVMIYVYGGGFKEGTSGTELYGPDFLLQKDIVFVSFNYRTGALGFLCCQSPKDDVPGNAGLKDQNMAIKWVVENIKAFGGDPEKITLCGHSAGACSVQYHIISDASKNLFQRAIIMSGSSYCDWALSQQRNWPEKLAKAIGWDETGNESDALKFLQTAKPEDIINHQEKLLGPQDGQEGVFIAFGPTIEPYQNASCIIPKHPLELAREGWGNNIDVMIGGTSEEGLLLLQKVKIQPEIFQDPKLFLHSVPANLEITVEQKTEFAEKLKQQYYPDSEPSYENNDGYVNMMTDKVFWHDMYRTILARANSGSPARTYVYRFAVDSDSFNLYRIMFIDPKLRGTSHCDELSYLFSNFTGNVPGETTFEYRAMQTLVDVFTSFVIKGDPNCERTVGVTWEPVTQVKPTFQCLNMVNDGITFVDFPDAARMDLWSSFYVNNPLY